MSVCLNPAKTQLIWLWLKRQVDVLDLPIMATSVRMVDSACDLCVVVDSHVIMTTHVSAVCREAYYQLRRLIRSLSSDAAKLPVQAFISTSLHYCNSQLYGINDNLYQCIQAVQNGKPFLNTAFSCYIHCVHEKKRSKCLL